MQLYKRMVPGHQTEMLCITLLCIPDAILTDIANEAGDASDDLLKRILEYRRKSPRVGEVLASEILILSKAFSGGK